MEALIRPEFGLMFWTIACFVLLALLLSKTAWKPLMQAVDERERAIKRDRDSAEAARAAAEKIKTELDAQLDSFRKEVQGRMDDARATAERDREFVMVQALKTSSMMLDSAKKEIEVQKLEAVRELKNKVAELSVMAAERILMKQLDHRANTDLASKYLAELEKERPDLKMEN